MRIEGSVQTAEYGSSSWRFWFKLRKDAKNVSTTSATPTVLFYTPAGVVIGTAVNLTQDVLTGWWYCDVDLSATGTWQLGMYYKASITFEVDSVEYPDHELFDVVMWPFNEPAITTEEYDIEHPTWVQVRPTDWADWTPAIGIAHRKLAGALRKLRDRDDNVLRPSLVMDRNQLRTLELAYLDQVAAEECMFPTEDQKKYRQRVYVEMGEFTRFLLDTDEDLVVDAGEENSTGPGFFR